MCSDGWQAARFLVALGLEDASTPHARAQALALRQEAGGDAAGFVALLFQWVKTRIRFVREHGEVFARSDYTIAVGAGDCDDHARVVYALLLAGGVPARLAFLSKAGDPGPRHVAAQAYVDGRWVWMETTIDAELGEHPYRAAQRLGLLGQRADIATEVRTMNERDLAPIPAGFEARNPPDALAMDVEALKRLGWLGADRDVASPTDPHFREALACFQETRGLQPVDGLIGPETRRELAAALRAAGPPISEGFGYPGLGDAARSQTAHLSTAFFHGVIDMANRFRAQGATATPQDFLAVWLAESGIRPDLPNGAGAPFYGLNQLGLPMHAKAVGWSGTPAEYLALSAANQLPYVERYYRNVGRPSSYRDAGSLYLANFLPAFLDHAHDGDFILASRDDDRHGWYRDNASLDVDGDGAIRVNDLTPAIERAKRARSGYWAEVVARLEEAERTPRGGVGVDGAVGLVLVAMTAALAWWYGGQS